MPRQLDLLARSGLDLKAEAGRSEPRLWVRRLVIWSEPGTMLPPALSSTTSTLPSRATHPRNMLTGNFWELLRNTIAGKTAKGNLIFQTSSNEESVSKC